MTVEEIAAKRNRRIAWIESTLDEPPGGIGAMTGEKADALREELIELYRLRDLKQIDDPLDLSSSGSYYIDRIYHTHFASDLKGILEIILLLLFLLLFFILILGMISRFLLVACSFGRLTVHRGPRSLHHFRA